MGCLTSARFTMTATVLRQKPLSAPPVTPTGLTTYQDPISGEIIENWSYEDSDPQTPDSDGQSTFDISCVARGIVDGGIRVAGSTERVGDFYEAVDWVKLWVPANKDIRRSDRITNVRWKKGATPVWVDDSGAALQFNVNGVVPLFDAFNRPVEKYILMQRVDSPRGAE